MPDLLALCRTFRNWGATEAEMSVELPGDDLVSDPATSTTRAIAIDAPAVSVWPWLLQMGQDKGGMYSYDWLENLVGLHIHSADAIRPEWQQLAVGDRIRLVPNGWLGLTQGLALPVALVDPPRSLVLRESPSDTPWDAVWSFHVLSDGPDRCRLLSRSRSATQHGFARLVAGVMDLVALVMTRKMLLGVKARAESRPAPSLMPS